MYRRLKNILGVSLMVLAIVIAQIPMPEAQADNVREMTEADLPGDDTSAHVVTFSMNGGTYNGTYNGYSFQDKTPVLVIDDGKTISSFPDDKCASYTGYKTEAVTWYSDKECMTKYDADRPVKQSITLYKKWYNITSDGSTLADKGFHISADGTVLYRYDGDDTLVEIPQTVTTIASGAFDNLAQEVRGIILPGGIMEICEHAFNGLKASIIYIYDSDTAASKDYGKRLAEEYEQLVYSEYLDPEKTEEIVGIDYLSGSSDEENGETPGGDTDSTEDRDTEGKTEKDSDSESENDGKEPSGDKSDPEESEEDSAGDKSDPEQSDAEPTEGESEKESDPESEDDGREPSDGSTPDETPTTGGSSSSVIIIDPDQEYTVTFDTGISGVEGEERPARNGHTISELVKVNGDQPRILREGVYQIEQDDGKQDIVYTFQGWYKDNAYTVKWDFANDEIEQDTTIYAKWDKQTRAYFYVTYLATEGNEAAANIPSDKQKLYEDEKLEKPSKNPSIKNKTFKGWYTNATDAKTAYTSWGKPVTADLTLYAHFEEKTNTVVFHMNGGGFTGTYNGTSYTDAASLTAKITVGKGISASEYPAGGSSASFKYSNYATDSNWYKDKECLEVYSQKDSGGNDTVVKGDLTLYKKWYYTSSGFSMNTSGNVLYKYSGNVADVVIPNSVTIIGSNAFASMGSISTITLPDNISEIKENAFSGLNNVSKDITITGKSENARNVARGLANQYTRLVYKEGTSTNDTSKTAENNDSVVSKAASGSIQLGAVISGSTGTTGNGSAAAASNATAPGTIALGAGSVGMTTATSVQPAASQPSTVNQSAAVSQNATSSTSYSTSGTSATAAQGSKTTQKQNLTSASAPKGTQHIKDSTPKTGDPLQYRMLVVCAMFSVGVLLVLTGNGKKKKFSAS